MQRAILSGWLLDSGAEGRAAALELARDDRRMFQLVQRLGRLLPDEAVEEKLVELCSASDPEVRRAAIFSLASSDTAASLQAVRKALRDPEPQARWEAVSSLTRRTDWASQGDVLALCGDPSDQVRLSVVGYIRRLPDKSGALGCLAGLASDPYGEVAGLAMLALVGTDMDEARRAALAARSDPDPAVRRIAEQILGR